MRGSILSRAWLLLVGSLVGCYSPRFAECAIACVDDNGCPAAMSCNRGLCARAGTASCARDLGMPDGNTPACVAPAHPSEIWVDSNAPAGGVGTEVCPFQRVTDGIAAATARGAARRNRSSGDHAVPEGEPNVRVG